MTVTLYRLEGCPYCERVVDTLEELNVAFDSVWTEGLHSKRDEVRSVTGQRQVPVLLDDEYGVSMSQSARIIEYLETTYGGAEPTDAVPSDAES
jgi:glutaredoxin